MKPWKVIFSIGILLLVVMFIFMPQEGKITLAFVGAMICLIIAPAWGFFSKVRKGASNYNKWLRK